MKSVRVCAILLFCLLCLAGCGRKVLPTETEALKEETSGKETFGQKTPGEEAAGVPAVDWEAAGFRVSGEFAEEQEFWASEYIRWGHEAISYDNSEELLYSVRELGALEGRIYRLCDIRGKEEEIRHRYQLEIYDTRNMQTTVMELDQERLGVGDGFIAGMDVVGEEEFGVFLLKYARDESGEFILQSSNIVFTDLKERAEKADALAAFQEKGIQNKMYQEYFCDASGIGFVRGAYRDSPARFLYVLDRNGSLLSEQSVDEYEEIRPPFQMPEGELIFI